MQNSLYFPECSMFEPMMRGSTLRKKNILTLKHKDSYGFRITRT